MGTITRILLRPLEGLLGRGLAGSSSAQAVASELEGRSLGLVVDGLPIKLRLHVDQGRLRMEPADGEPADATLSGTALAFGRLLRDDPQAAIREGWIHLEGDTDTADRFRDLLHFAAPDLEEELARLTGDTLAHQAGLGVRRMRAWGQAAGDKALHRSAEWLRGDAGLVPTAAELDDFAAAVDMLVDDIARAEARIGLLQQENGS